MIIKITVILLLATATTVQCINLIFKKDAGIERIKNKSRMEDFYSHACKDDVDCIRCAARRLLDKAARGNAPANFKLAEAFKGIDDISAVTVRQVWLGNSGGSKFWIAECRSAKPEKSLLLYFVKNRGRFILDEVD